MQFIRKGIEMAANWRRTIFGIPHDDQTATVGNAVVDPQPDALPKYLPASRLTEKQISGVGETGDVWIPWRVDGSGQWYQRISGDDAARPAMVIGLADDDDLSADDDDADDDGMTDDEHSSVVIDRLRSACDRIKARYGIVDDDDSGADENDE